jgi:transcriptional regulator with XRE-family HTH domain
MAMNAPSLAEQFGKNLAYCRRRGGFSQEELAVMASLHRTAVGQLERGERTARVDTFVKLIGSLEIDPRELLDGINWTAGGTRLGQYTFPQEESPSPISPPAR